MKRSHPDSFEDKLSGKDLRCKRRTDSPLSFQGVYSPAQDDESHASRGEEHFSTSTNSFTLFVFYCYLQFRPDWAEYAIHGGRRGWTPHFHLQELIHLLPTLHGGMRDTLHGVRITFTLVQILSRCLLSTSVGQ